MAFNNKEEYVYPTRAACPTDEFNRPTKNPGCEMTWGCMGVSRFTPHGFFCFLFHSYQNECTYNTEFHEFFCCFLFPAKYAILKTSTVIKNSIRLQQYTCGGVIFLWIKRLYNSKAYAWQRWTRTGTSNDNNRTKFDIGKYRAVV